MMERNDDYADPIDAVVEMGRTVIKCRHEVDTWCSCKVRDLAIRMKEAGWTPPVYGASEVDRG